MCPLTPAELLCDRAGVSTAEAAANMDRGSVPSNMELRGSGTTEEEEEEEEEVLPLRVPRRDLVSVTWVERQLYYYRLINSFKQNKNKQMTCAKTRRAVMIMTFYLTMNCHNA